MSLFYGIQPVSCVLYTVCFTASVLMLTVEALHLPADRFTDIFNNIFCSFIKNFQKHVKA